MLTYSLIKTPSAAQLRQIMTLYSAAGWHDSTDKPARYRAMVKGSQHFAVAELDGKIIAMGRAIGDGANDAYIQDIFVLPQHRKQGIAAGLLKKLLAQLNKDGMRWTGLIADRRAASLYRRLGLRPMKGFVPMRLLK